VGSEGLVANQGLNVMPRWKRSLLNLYYHGSYPLRAGYRSWLQATGQMPIAVLFYHRIADDRATPWTASNSVFERQVRWLQRNFDLISLGEAQRRLRRGRNHRPAVVITFDDGYADNCTLAMPLLIERNIPCTYFICSQQIVRGAPFAHDAARGLALAPNTPAQIRALAAAGIEIGAHTRTHADLGRLTDPRKMHDEIVVVRDELEQMAGAEVRYFAFPFGQKVNLSPQAFHLAREAGYEAVCSAYGGWNRPGDDAFHIQRIHADDSMIRFKNSILLDPIMRRSVERYPYRIDATPAPGEFVGAGA
jgi:peptidoglycan/xylan/chitin deacetylase (PgdA/CDA1 family)